jgi:lipid-A-disaccharide synthase-like uncharacterized protein
MRRWLFLVVLAIVVGLCLWVGLALADRGPRPAGAIDIKVQLRGAADRALLMRTSDGSLAYHLRLDDGTPLSLDPVGFAERVFADQSSRGTLEVLLNVTSPVGFAWVSLGLLGQLLFTGRMLVQWLASERNRRSVVPPSFWWMSLCGATMLLVYFVWRQDPVGVLGQAFGWVVYVRNLWLIHGPSPAPTA